MAVRAKYLPNVLLVNRAENKMNNKEIDRDFPPPPHIEQSPVFFSSNGGNVNRRKRGRKAATMEETTVIVAAPPPQQIVFSLQSPSTLSLLQLQSRRPPVVSTGLRLALDEQKPSQIKKGQADSLISLFFLEDLAAQINQEKNEIEQFLISQGEQLRRAMAERHQRHYRTLLDSAGRRLREKDMVIERVALCNAELEERLTRLQTESSAWQAKAMADETEVASLHAQLRKEEAAAAEMAARPGGEEFCGNSPAGDAESAYVDPDRSEAPERPCRACRRRPATVVLLPCCHLCICVACDSTAAVGEGCPACGCFRTGSLEVSFS